MTTERQRRIRELFEAVSDQPQESQDEYLWQACGGDEELARAVGKLLRARNRAGGVLDTPVHQRATVPAPVMEPGVCIGPYKVLQEFGGGGMGVVYQVVRADEVFHRVAALKIIRPEVCSKPLLERFRQERHILARLDHPNISRIVDGGSTPEGLPYFVMDYVDGVGIDRFCTQHALSLQQRLALFQQVCAAVQYLHDNFVVHSDLKPSNILVTGGGVVKILDFGVASVLQSKETESPADHRLPLMTPGYASPEQMRGARAAPASDIYSLGVILYELLTGTRPFESGNRSLSELLTAIDTQDPLPPSSARLNISALPAPGGAAHLGRILKGDLDRIVLRAIARNPQARYPSAAAFQTDIANYLSCRPVAAAAGGPLYRAGKFVRRNLAAAAAGAILIALLTLTSWQGLELRKHKLKSQTLEEQLHRSVNKYDELLKQRQSMLRQPAPDRGTASPDSFEMERLRQLQLFEVRNLAEAYHTSLSEAVRLWPGMTRSRRELLDRAETYLHEAEPFVASDPRARQQLALAWLWLADVQGNPQSPNLHDHTGALASIHESERLLNGSPGAPAGLAAQIKAAAKLIQGVRD